jgi:hypothetical protein
MHERWRRAQPHGRHAAALSTQRLRQCRSAAACLGAATCLPPHHRALPARPRSLPPAALNACRPSRGASCALSLWRAGARSRGRAGVGSLQLAQRGRRACAGLPTSTAAAPRWAPPMRTKVSLPSLGATTLRPPGARLPLESRSSRGQGEVRATTTRRCSALGHRRRHRPLRKAGSCPTRRRCPARREARKQRAGLNNLKLRTASRSPRRGAALSAARFGPLLIRRSARGRGAHARLFRQQAESVCAKAMVVG